MGNSKAGRLNTGLGIAEKGGSTLSGEEHSRAALHWAGNSREGRLYTRLGIAEKGGSTLSGE